MKTLLLGLLLGVCVPPALAQDLQVATRFDYYFEEDSSATLVVFGNRWSGVESLTVAGDLATPETPHSDAARFQIGIDPYHAGSHRIPCRAAMADGSVVNLTLTLIKLPPRSGAVRVDRLTGGLMVDDLPFFPFGFYASYPVGDLPVQEIYNAMNLIGVYQANDDETLAGRKAYMDLCASVGMKVNYAVNGLIGTPHNQTDALITSAEEERRWAQLRREVETFKDHPALLSWYMNDEPVGQSRDPGLLEKAYRIIKEIDPYHPVSVVFVIPDRAAPFMNALDIAMTDPYPIPGDVDAVRTHMSSLANHFRFRKALWLVPQAFGGGEFWSREPTGPEIRTMTWLGIQEGAMGIQYFIRRHPNLFPKSRLAWNEAVRVAHEVSMIQPWLFADEPRHTLNTGSERVRALALPYDQSTLILVTNADNHPAPFAIDTSNLATGDSTHLVIPFEDRSIVITGGRLADTLGPLDTRAYLIGHPWDAGAGSPQNLFPNPGFEWIASPGVPAGSYADSDRRPGYDGSTYFVDSRISHTGRNSLRMRAVSDTSHLRLTFQRMYVQEGRTYHASLWSKRPKYSGPTTFVLEIPQLDFRRELETNDTWSRHDLRFKASSETPFVQLALETSGAGTVWIDDPVVVPDPIIDVTVEEGPRALVSVRSEDDGATFRYRLNGTDPRTYAAPIEISKFTDIDLTVMRLDWPDETIPITIPLSLATKKTCRFITAYSEKYDGSGDGTVVDGEYGSLAFRDDRYLGFDGKDVEFTVDLGTAVEVRSVTVHFLVSPDDGIHSPRSVEAWTTSDEVKWTSLGRTEDLEASRNGSPYHQAVQVEGPIRSARHVRVKVSSPKVIPTGYLFSGTDAWLFIDEVLVE